MNRERAKELLPVIQAFAEGKDIEFQFDGKWLPVLKEDALDTKAECTYRIKPEPFECWVIREKEGIDNSGEWYSYRPSISIHQDRKVIHMREVE